MSRVFWDTNLFIYLFENYGPFSQAAAALRARMLTRGDQLLTSALTLGEVLVKPLEMNDYVLCAKYEHAFATSLITLPFEVKAARIYASLRSDRSLRAPDAIQLACAASAGVDLFVTNDARLQGKQVAGIQFIVPLDRVPI
ncbi:MAG: PIN domain-containing protein [Acidobacteriia bacterium]|nr:PIN domain-containing protein [Terriglobia bacterium]